MKKLVLLLLFPLAVACKPTISSLQNPDTTAVEQQVLATDSLLKFEAQPQAGFNFAYLVYLPKGLKSGQTNYLLVESNNTGLNDTQAYHERGAEHAAAKSSVGNYVAKNLQIPLLVPVFPRSQTNWMFYTHALDRETMLDKNPETARLDLQLLAMIKHAKQQLAKQGYPLQEKFFITGFSASGTFANRFSLLHPESIKATASGGINAIAILPVTQLEGQRLNYPPGIADVEELMGKPVNLKAFKELPKLLYMGALDENDAAAFDDAYSKEDRETIYNLMGKQLIPQRWEFMERLYREHGISADFRTYPAIGHGTDLKINNDLVEFFRMHTK